MTPHHHDPIQDNINTHPVKVAIWITLGALAVIIAIIMLAHYAVSSYGTRDLKDHPSMSPEAVKKRIAPVAQVRVDPNAPKAAPASAAPATPGAAPATMPPAAPVKTAAAAGGGGKSTYDSACAMCHTAGVAGAPKLGDKAAWSARLGQGAAAMHASAIKGKGAMPPKGGNTALSDDAVKAAVDFMLASAK